MSPFQEIGSNLARAAAIVAIIEKRQLKKHQKITIKFFKKFVSNCNAIMILHEAGLTDEPYTIHRLSMEHLFNIAALLKNPNFLEQLQAKSEGDISKILKVIKGDEDSSPVLTKENRAQLEAGLKIYDQNPIPDLGYSIFNAARISDLSYFYNNHYRLLSLCYAHSTLASALKDGDRSKERDKLLIDVNDFLKISVKLIEEEFNPEGSRP